MAHHLPASLRREPGRVSAPSFCADCGRPLPNGMSLCVGCREWRDHPACEECGCDIPAKRLKAIPGTRFCIACQGARDRMVNVTDAPAGLAEPGEFSFDDGLGR